MSASTESTPDRPDDSMTNGRRSASTNGKAPTTTEAESKPPPGLSSHGGGAQPVVLRTWDGRTLLLPSGAGAQTRRSHGTEAAALAAKGHPARPSGSASKPSAVAGNSLSKLPSSSDSQVPGKKSPPLPYDTGKVALSFRRALGSGDNKATCSNGPSSKVEEMDSPKDQDSRDGSPAMPKIRFSFPPLAAAAGRTMSRPSASLASSQVNSPRFVVVKSGSGSSSTSAPSSTNSASASSSALPTTSSGSRVSRQSSRPVMLSSSNSVSSSGNQRMYLRGNESKQFIGTKRKLNEDQRSVVAKGVPNVYVMPSSGRGVSFQASNHNFQSSLSSPISTSQSVQNGKVVYISPDAIVSLKEGATMKKRQLLNNRRPCNCTKSQCLKLYCDCFANGEFCSNCHCTNCLNNLANEVDRSKAIKSCLERNPMAFQPKIGKGKADTDRLHNKGCNCKKSSCLKNYCECYEARVSCTVRCKCFGCRNTEADRSSRNRGNMSGLGTSSASSSGPLHHVYSSVMGDYGPVSPSSSVEDFGDRLEFKRLPKKFINDEVIEAMTKVLVATAEELANKGVEDDATIQIEIVKAYGTCLKKLIDTVSA